MVITSMLTESYVEWIYHFLYGLKNNTREEIVIFLINFSEKSKSILESEFPYVKFRDVKTDLVLKETVNPDKKSFKVTYLKGQCVQSAYQEFKENILWIDITALIRSDISNLTRMFESAPTLLMRRNFAHDFGKSIYACEIFGMSNKKEIERYAENCDKRKEEWFADQLALCEIEGEKEYINFGEWSNFNYEKDAKSWSDRGRTGSGKVTSDDISFTHEVFIKDLEKTFPTYRNDYDDFVSKFVKKKILIHTDASDWCYYNTVQEIQKIPDFEFTIIYDVGKQLNEVKAWKGDLVWGRCGSYRHKKLLNVRPDLRPISFSTVTTGGELLIDRFYKQISDNKGEAGVILQNSEAQTLMDYYIRKNELEMETFILPNGVDTEIFTPKEHTNSEEYIVGFVGRNAHPDERSGKGWHYFTFCTELADLKTMVASNLKGYQVDYKDMPEFYHKIDCLLLPSNIEGCANTINEAMASGLPVITTKHAWHGENCDKEVYFSDRNINSILKALNELRDPNLRKAYGKKARLFAEEHSWENLFDYYRKTFNEMIRVAKANKPIVKAQKVQVPEIPGKEPSGTFMLVEGLRKVSLGKIERNGANIWFTKGMKRRVPNDKKHRERIMREVDAGYLRIIE